MTQRWRYRVYQFQSVLTVDAAVMKHKFLDDVTQIFSDLFFALAFQEHKRQRAKHKVHRHEENQWHQLSGTAVAAWRHLDALTNQLSLPILVYSCINIPRYVNNHTCSPVRLFHPLRWGRKSDLLNINKVWKSRQIKPSVWGQQFLWFGYFLMFVPIHYHFQ